MNTNSTRKPLTTEAVAIQNCENDVINEIDFIQPPGCLLACYPKDGTITHASENSAICFGVPAIDLLGQSLYDLLGPILAHTLRNAAGHSTISLQREYIGCFESAQTSFDVFAHKKRKRLIVELQRSEVDNASSLLILDTIQRMLRRLNTSRDPQALVEAAVTELRTLTGFHRVKVYRFLPDGAGEVIAESREPQVDSFLGLRFPAHDVPQAARVLYASTPIRLIPSVHAAPVPILQAANEIEPLDLSLALCRGVAPVHLQYLKNMGVQSSLSLPIVIDGKMWGLFACHHMEEYTPRAEVISALKTLGSSASMLLSALFQKNELDRTQECARLAGTLFVPDESPLGFSAYWEVASPELMKLIQADGLVLLGEKQKHFSGECPPEEFVHQLANQLDIQFQQNSEPTPISACDSIYSQYPALEPQGIAGVLAIRAPGTSYRYLFFFRKQSSKVVRWAGAPQKDIEQTAQGYRLNPRASFKEYIESSQKRSDPFGDNDLLVAQALKRALENTMASLSIHRKNKQRLGLVVRELNHRVRNTLALVSSMVSQSRNKDQTVDTFIHTLEKRIQALAETHKLLSEYEWKPVRAHLLFERVLAPFRTHLKSRLILRGDEISLPPELASLLALVTHELAANAAKYGALANAAGQVLLNWHLNNGNLTIEWLESGGPVVSPPSHQGFGSTLIREALAYEFDAQCDLDYLPQGVHAKFSIPNFNAERTEPTEASHDLGLEAVKTRSFVALLLEDDFLIAKETESMIKNLGATQVDICPSLDRAEACIAKTNYHFALLDANIRGEFSGRIASILKQKKIPFAFATGYGTADPRIRATGCMDVLSKPLNEEKLLDLLNAVRSTEYE